MKDTVFLVFYETGEYDDYNVTFVKAFESVELAEAYVKRVTALEDARAKYWEKNLPKLQKSVAKRDLFDPDGWRHRYVQVRAAQDRIYDRRKWYCEPMELIKKP